MARADTPDCDTFAAGLREAIARFGASADEARLLAFAAGHRHGYSAAFASAREAVAAELSAAASQAPADTTAAAVDAERERIRAILALDEARGRTAAAIGLALAGLPPEQAAAALAGLPVECALPPPPRREAGSATALVTFAPHIGMPALSELSAERTRNAWSRAIGGGAR